MEYAGLYKKKTQKGLALVNTFNNYYANYILNGYLYDMYIETKSIKKSIIPRLNFMKSEVKELKKLLKQGYTHV